MLPHYKALRRIENPQHWRYLTFSCFHSLPLLGAPSTRNRLMQHLAASRERCKFLLRAWVIMPNHVHLIIRPTHEKWPVPAILRAIKQPHAQSTLRELRRACDPILTHLTDADGSMKYWQPGGGFDRNIRSSDELEREIQYIHDNPVKRELALSPREWRWSSARWYVGEREGQIPIDD